MTISYTTPTSPTFTNFDIPTPISIDVPDLPSSDLDVDTFDGDQVNARLNTFQYERYGQVTQNVIDGKIENLLDWTGDTAIDEKFALAKERIMYPALVAKQEIMKEVASWGWPQLPGSAKKRIYDLHMEAKQKLSEEAFKLFEEEVKISNAHFEFALKAGIDKEKGLMDHHNNIQMLTLEATVEIAKNLYDTYLKNAEAYNKRLADWEQALQNHQAQRETKLAEREAFIAQLESIATYEQRNVRDAELFDAAIKLVDVENREKLAEIKLEEIAARTSRAQVEAYHAELKQYMANIDVIQAQYRQYRAYVRGVIYDKDAYLKRLQAQRLEIQEYLQTIQQDKKRAQLDLEQARLNIETFKQAIEEFNAVTEEKKREYDVSVSDYRNDLIQWGTNIRDSLSAALNSYEESISDLEAGLHEDIGLMKNETGYNSSEYASWIAILKLYGELKIKAQAQEEAARLKAEMALEDTLTHTITESES